MTAINSTAVGSELDFEVFFTFISVGMLEQLPTEDQDNLYSYLKASFTQAVLVGHERHFPLLLTQ